MSTPPTARSSQNSPPPPRGGASSGPPTSGTGVPCRIRSGSGALSRASDRVQRRSPCRAVTVALGQRPTDVHGLDLEVQRLRRDRRRGRRSCAPTSAPCRDRRCSPPRSSAPVSARRTRRCRLPRRSSVPGTCPGRSPRGRAPPRAVTSPTWQPSFSVLASRCVVVRSGRDRPGRARRAHPSCATSGATRPAGPRDQALGPTPPPARWPRPPRWRRPARARRRRRRRATAGRRPAGRCRR